MVATIYFILFSIIVSFSIGWIYGWAVGRMERRALRREMNALETKNKLLFAITNKVSKEYIESKDALIG